jgi:hypothetical protein
MFGLTKLDDDCHICRAPSRQATKLVHWEARQTRDVMKHTSADQISIWRVGTCRDLSPGTALFRLDNDHCLLFAFVLDVPESDNIGEYPEAEVKTHACLIVESAELVMKYC